MSFNFMAAVPVQSDFGAPQIKPVTSSIFSPSTCHEVIGPDASLSSLFFFFFWPDLTACGILVPHPEQDGTCAPCIGRWGLGPWTVREVPA